MSLRLYIESLDQNELMGVHLAPDEQPHQTCP